MTDNPFHQHLDACAQCRDQPFNLCAEGGRLLQFSATTSSLYPWPTKLDRLERLGASHPDDV